jgi:hypothetical protein
VRVPSWSNQALAKEAKTGKQQQANAVGKANYFEEGTINPKQFPALASKHVCLESDADIGPILRDIAKLSETVKSVHLLKVSHFNGGTTSLVEVPCSAKLSGFKKAAKKSRWVLRVLHNV